jgi:hypothetical protein
VPTRALRFTRSLLPSLVLVHLLAAVPVLAHEGSTRETGVVVGTPGLTIRVCPDVSCASSGFAPLQDPIIVTGPAENGYLPVGLTGVRSGFSAGDSP